jgi:hypothetical protein
MSRKRFVVAVISVLLVAGVATASDAAVVSMLRNFWQELYSGQDAVAATAPLLTMDVVAKAVPDECYLGIGEVNVYPFDPNTETCSAGRLKVNEAYVFGLTEANGTLWFGSAPNMRCMFWGTIAEASPLEATPFESTNVWTCEYGASRYGLQAGLPGHLGDWRPPSIRTYNTRTGAVEEKVVTGDPLIRETLGLRAAGALGDVVFLAGPTLTGLGGPVEMEGGINLFAFHSRTGQYLGSRQFLQYNNIRKFVVVGGVLYAGVAVNKAQFPATGEDTPFGAVLRWTGSAAAPFSFEIVGWMDGEAAELVEHDGRIFVSTWPDFNKLFEPEYDYAGLWMSPVLDVDGLKADDANSWQKVWSVSDYEVDEVTARMYNGGALASYQGYLYWGSLHAALAAGLTHALFYQHLEPGLLGIPDIGAITAALLGTHRPISIFRGRDFGTSVEHTEVLYGLRKMPAFVDNRWTILSNRMGKPKYGRAGFGNAFNTYTWTMAVHDGALYVGTVDWSYILATANLQVVEQSVTNFFPEFKLPGTTPGADLFVFPSSQGGAVLVEGGGMRNYASHGVRTMIATDDALYLGMANYMNLMTDPNDKEPEGGWELIRVMALQCDSSGIAGDFNRDGRVRILSDGRGFRECYTGSCRQGNCPLPLYDDPCCSIGDFDGDGDVDMRDFRDLFFARFF